MKKLIILIAPLLLTAHLSYSQTETSDTIQAKAISAKPDWQVGLHAAPLLRHYKQTELIGFTVFPGIYRTSGRLMYGFTPFYSRTDYSYQATSNIPENIHEVKINSYGGIFQLRYYLNDKRLRPYILLQAGFGYHQEKFSALPQYGGSFTDNYWEFNFGTGFGATYKINDRWSLDGNIRFDLLLSPEKEYDVTGYLTLGILRRIGK